MSDLLDWMESPGEDERLSPPPPADDEEPSRFLPAEDEPPPMTAGEAEWLIARVVAHRDRIAEVKANAEALIRREQEEVDRLLAREGERLRAFLVGHLDRGRRSWRCLAGVAGFRTVPARLTVADPDAALRWALAQPEPPVRVDVARAGKPAAFAGMDEHGAVIYLPPPGFAVTPERTVLDVRSGRRAGAPEPEEERIPCVGIAAPRGGEEAE